MPLTGIVQEPDSGLLRFVAGVPVSGESVMKASVPHDHFPALDHKEHGEPLKAFMALADKVCGKPFPAGENCEELLDSALRLERCLGIALLERRGNSCHLSTAGNLLLDYARKVHPEHGSARKPLPGDCLARQRRFLPSQTDEVANRLVSNTMDFVASQIRADSSLFFWIGTQGEMIDLQSRGVNLDLLGVYEKELGRYDPLHITKLCAESRHIASLSYTRKVGVEIPQHYVRHLVQIDIGDELDMVFWMHGRPIACMAFYRRVDGDPFSLDDVDWTALHRHTENFLNMHWRFRSGHIESVLVESFCLTPRELDVVEWMVSGKSNWDIARILDISEATVKVHAASVLKKLGAESRSAVPAMVSGL